MDHASQASRSMLQQLRAACVTITVYVFLTMQFGCTANAPHRREHSLCRHLLEEVPEIERRLHWIEPIVSAQQHRDTLISIDVDPEWNHVGVLVRYVEGEGLVCEFYDDEGPSKIAYRVSSPAAISTFRNLYAQAAEGYAYRANDYPSGSNPRSNYLITTGTRVALTADRGGYFDTYVAIDTALRVDRAAEDGKLPEDPDEAVSDLGPGVLSSPATYLIFGVGCLDSLCTCTYLAESGSKP